MCYDIWNVFPTTYYILCSLNVSDTICCVWSREYIKNLLDRLEEKQYNKNVIWSILGAHDLQNLKKKGCCNMQLSVCLRTISYKNRLCFYMKYFLYIFGECVLETHSHFFFLWYHKTFLELLISACQQLTRQNHLYKWFCLLTTEIGGENCENH